MPVFRIASCGIKPLLRSILIMTLVALASTVIPPGGKTLRAPFCSIRSCTRLRWRRAVVMTTAWIRLRGMNNGWVIRSAHSTPSSSPEPDMAVAARTDVAACRTSLYGTFRELNRPTVTLHRRSDRRTPMKSSKSNTKIPVATILFEASSLRYISQRS